MWGEWRMMDDRNAQSIAGGSANFARDADGAVEIGPIWSDLQIINHIAAGAAKILGETLPNFRVRSENEQPIHLIRQAKLLRRAHHAVRFDAANFADFDGERLLTRLGGKSMAWQNERHFVAGFEIVRAADNLAFAFAVIDPAEQKLVRIGMFVAGQDLGHDNAFELAA